MKTLELWEINERCHSDPAGFIQTCEQEYQDTICTVAERVCASHLERPIVLLNGPSSSGKTTTARRLRDELERRGIRSHAISMDDYYQTRAEYDMPLDEEGKEDLESPLCMDLPMLSRHLTELTEGKAIQVPHYDFANRRRSGETQEVQLRENEIAVIEGIHALNDVIVGPLENRATGIYMAIGTEVAVSRDFRLAPHELRFVRRAIRDKNFRSEPVRNTINMWHSVRRGERLYIHPYVPHAAQIIDTYLPYEDAILMNRLRPYAISCLNELHTAGLEDIIHALDLFEEIEDLSPIPEQSIMHEFIG